MAGREGSGSGAAANPGGTAMGEGPSIDGGVGGDDAVRSRAGATATTGGAVGERSALETAGGSDPRGGLSDVRGGGATQMMRIARSGLSLLRSALRPASW